MEAPKCKICGERHYRMCPSVQGSRGSRESRPASIDPQVAEANSRHREGKTVPKASAKTGKASTTGKVPQAKSGSDKRLVERSAIPSAGVASGPRESAPKKNRAPNGTFDRKAYQREYMKKVRKGKKAPA